MNIKEIIIESIEALDFNTAAEYLEEYDHNYGRDEFYYLARSDILLGHEDYQGVIDVMERALDLGYDHPIFYERLADAYIGLQDWKTALNWLHKCEDYNEEDPEGDLHRLFLFGKVYLGKEEYKKAVSYFEDILLETEDEEIYFLAACCYWQMKKQKRAFEYFDRIRYEQDILEQICLFLSEENDPRMIDYVQDLENKELKTILTMQHYYFHESPEKALKYAQEQARTFCSIEFYNQLILMLEDLKKYHTANLYKKKLIKLSSKQDDEAYAHLTIQIKHLLDLNYTEATNKKHLMKFIHDHEGSQRAKIHIAYTLAYIERFELAMYVLNDVDPKQLEYDEDLQAYHLLRAQVSFQLKQFEKAYRSFQYLKPLKTYQEFIDYLLTCFYTYRLEEAISLSEGYEHDGMIAGIRLACLDMMGDQEQIMEVIQTMDRAQEGSEEIPDLAFYQNIKKNLDVL